MSIYRALMEGPPPFRPVLLGYDDHGQPLELTFEDFRYHVHFLGLSGRGKSRAIEYILRQFILNGTGFTLLDPHGEIYDALVEWITWMEELSPGFLEERTIHLFDPADPEFAPGYNPLRVRDGEYAEGRVDWVIEAFAEMLGGEDPERMQQYQFIFNAVIYPVALRGLTLYDAVRVLRSAEKELLRRLGEDMPNLLNSQALEELLSWKERDYWDRVGSFYRRMSRIMRSPVMQRVLGQTENMLDTLEVMDQGQVLLVNLKPRDSLAFSTQTSRLIGKLLVNDFQQTARNYRPVDTARPHVLVIDECANYLSGDIPDILDGTRKYGLHLVLSHQRIEQLYEAGSNIAGAVMAGAQTKLILGSTYQTGAAIADEIFGSTYNLERPKENVKRPVTSGHRVRRLEGGAEAIADSHGYGEVTGEGGASGRSVGNTAGTSQGRNYDYESYFDALPSSRGYNSAASDSRSVAESQVTTRHHAVSTQQSTTVTATKSWREVLEPIIEWHPTDTYTIDELRHEAALRVKDLDPRRIILKRATGREVLVGTTAPVDRPVVAADTVRAQMRRLKSTTGINTPTPVVDQRIAARELAMRRAVGPIILPPERPETTVVDAQEATRKPAASSPASPKGRRRSEPRGDDYSWLE